MSEEKKDEEVLELDEELAEEEGFREKLKKLRVELAACRKEKEEYLAGWQRAKADFINARKDEEKARAEFLRYVEEKVLYECLAVADSLELALKLKPFVGLEQIYSQLLELLRKRGVTPLGTAGKKFNPLEAEAIEKVEVGEELRDDIILEELQKGYKLYDKILRPAKVKVGYYAKNFRN